MGKRQALQQVGKLDNCVQVDEVRILPHHTQKYTQDDLKTLNIRQDTINPPEDTAAKHFDINCINVFLGPSSKAIEIQTKISRLDLIKLRCFCTAKEIKTKRQPMDWEKILANDAADKGLVAKINSSHNSITTNKKWVQDLNKTFLQRRHTYGQ